MTDEKMRERFAQIREDYYLPPFDEDGLAELGEERFILFERGHYGQTWVSAHDTPADASNYTLNQEYAEDWSATVILDRETGEELVPREIEWETTTQRATRSEASTAAAIESAQFMPDPVPAQVPSSAFERMKRELLDPDYDPADPDGEGDDDEE